MVFHKEILLIPSSDNETKEYERTFQLQNY